MKKNDEREKLLSEATQLYNDGRLKEALAIFKQCHSLFADNDRKDVEFADFCGNYGSALAESGNLKLAEWMFNAALLIYKAKGKQNAVARIHFNLGNVYRYMNSRKPCFDNYKEGLEAYRACGDAYGEGLCLLQLANLYAGMGAIDIARERLAEVDRLDDSVKQAPLFRWSWRFQQSNVAMQDGQPEKSLELLEEALACARKLNDPSYAEETENAIANLHSVLGQTQDSISQLERAYHASKARQDRHHLNNTLALARALASKSGLEKAARFYDECLMLMEYTRGKLDGVERFHWMEWVATVSQEYSAGLFDQGYYWEALEVSERGQGRALLDLMFRHQIRLQGKRSIRAIGNGRVILNAPSQSDIRDALGAADACLFKLLETKNRTLAWLVSPDGSIEAWEVKSAISALREMIDLLLDSDKVSRPEAEGEVIEVRAHRPAQKVAWDEFGKVLSRLYESLFPANIRERLEKESGRLLIIPHLSYFHVPWAALGPGRGPSLGERWEIGVTPSVGVFTQLDRRRDPEPWHGLEGFRLPVLAVGGCGPQTIEAPILPAPGASEQISFCDLPGTREEAIRVAELLEGAAIVGPQADAATVRAASQISGVIHLATHGYWNMVVGDLSFLVFASSQDHKPDRSALFAHQLMRDDFATRAELVTLSGCQTGLGSAHPDTYINLAHSFLVAGARSVLVSLWPIRDDATVAFMEEFYLELRDGRSPAQALQRARNEMRRSKLWSDGWNWSGFVLVGNPFHSFEADAREVKLPGPAFCGGDFLCMGASEGDVLPLENFEKERQTSKEAWILDKGNIQKLNKY